MCDVEELGKPVERDAVLGRPSAVQELGIGGAVKQLESLVAGAVSAVPVCPGADELKALIGAESRRILPEKLAKLAA
jgi:geranylgeranyl diphosphate synthase type II